MLIYARDYVRMSAWCIGLTSLLSGALTLGQCLRLRELLWPPDALSAHLLGELIKGGVIILAEAALPISGLLGALLVSARSARLGYGRAFESLGVSPLAMTLPALGFGVTLSALGLWCSHYETPRTLRALSGVASELARARWSHIVPRVISRTSVKERYTNPTPLGRSPSLWRFKTRPTHTRWMITMELPDSPREVWFWSADFMTQGMSRVVSARWRIKREISPLIQPTPEPHPASPQASEPDIDLMTLRDLRVDSPQAHLSLGILNIPLESLGFKRALSTFSSPNSLDDAQLNSADVHQRFIALKRSALPLSALPLSLLGACWGRRRRARTPPIYLMLLSLAALGVTFALLRQLELCARAGLISAQMAAGAPCLILCVWALLEWARSIRWGDYE